MRKVVSLVASLFLAAAAHSGPQAGKTVEYAVQASASAQETPARITLHWPQDGCDQPQSYAVYRKAPAASSWGKPVLLSGAATEYVDKNVSTGVGYEYQIVKTTRDYTGYGYVSAGIKLPLVENRGRLLLIVDNTHTTTLAPELERLRQDLVGDGWMVSRFDVAPTDSVVSVKSLIKAQYAADPANVKAVFLFGHVPVAYSGDIVPDGHAPDHQGAWPSDGFYGDMDGVWTDNIVKDTKAAESRNRNVPGDGKYDQSTFPAALKLMVGRVDLSKMPGRLTYAGPATFPSETELLRNYLNKDHNFRHKQFDLPRRGVVGDYFGVRDGEAFAASGWRNLASFFSASEVTALKDEGTWISNLSSNSYLWAYGCGPGSFTSIGGLGKSDSYNDGVTTELYKNDPKAAFTMLFGSWLGDWDSEDNFQRAALALPSYGLTCVCSGRPHWFMHHMAMGEPIGYSTLLTQNNRSEGLYRNQQNNCAGLIHIALMGDPTLRMHTVAPAENLTYNRRNDGVELNWNPSKDEIVGYHVYRADNLEGQFTRLTASPIKETSFVDSTDIAGAAYMVRAVKLELSASGTYYNASQGIFAAPAEPAAIASVSTSTKAAAAPSDSSIKTSESQSPASVTPTGTTNTFVRALSPTGATAITNNTAWVNDALPTGAIGGSDGGDAWTWVASNPSPYSGAIAHQSSIAAGLHQHYFTYATSALTVNAGETLVAYVYLDPANLPSEIMLQWNDGSWEHRAYWGANQIAYGTDSTTSRRYMGPLPAPGQWARLEVPASQVALEGSTLSGMAFSQFDGRATWDFAGKSVVVLTNIPDGLVTTPSNSVSWVDDALPAGSIGGADGGDAWNWVSTAPAPASGSLANQSAIAAGLHQHYFSSATTTLAINPGDYLYTYVYLDPLNPPTELMLQWNNGSWEHRAYWGANMIAYGVGNTTSRLNLGALPAAGQWVRLEVPASQLGLEGTTLNGMAFSLYGGRATFDNAGKSSGSITNVVPPVTNLVPVLGTNTTKKPIVVISDAPTTVPPVVSTNTPPTTNPPPVISTNGLPGLSIVDYATLALPPAGTNTLHVLSPTLLELKLITSKQPDPAPVSQWDLVDGNGNFAAPSASAFTVTVNGQPVAVTAVGFKRRPLYAPFEFYDLRVENSMYLQLASPLSDNQTIQVKNPAGNLWSSSMQFAATADPLRFSPAIHVNQEGYMPGYTKKAMVGYYLGNLGEMTIPVSSGFKLVDANTGAQVYQGTLVQRADQGYTYAPLPYQKVYEADFTSFNTPGEYRLVVPGMGGSLPFLIDNGIAMDFARTYALGLYHQRCGTNTAMPYTRFNHDICHSAPASVPMPASSYNFTWNTIANYGANHNSDNPVQTAPNITATSQLFPFNRQGTIDTTGGHHDAGDYSKYTINSASLVHFLMFSVDSLPGVADLDNMGIPESGDGISDVLQEAKWEADYIAKLQDTDGGFYFLTYPVNREYEAYVTPDHGDPQVVWPKTTSVTAASVAALAQCASSPAFKQAYPATAALYLQKAKLGWQFLMNAINKYGRTGAYQKITHYGDNFADQDELAWAACEMFLATGDQTIHQQLLSWFNPADPATMRWGWWHLSECYGHAIRSYAFAARNGRVSSTSQLDATFLGKCQTEIAAAGDDVMTWSKMSAYGTSFPDATKRVLAAGWYFSTDQAFDVAVAYQLNQKQDYLDALLANMNYEGGCNPINQSYVTGLGWKRQRDIVSQWHSVTPNMLPPTGIPYGNVTATFTYLSTYGGMLEGLCFPSDSATTAPYPFYDRWGDSWNVNAEMVVLNQARSLGALSYLAARTALKTQPWKAVPGQIIAPTATVQVGVPVTLSLQAPGVDLSSARITWEVRDQDPGFGSTFTVLPKNNGAQWVEAEAQLPDGRRVFAKGTFNVNSPNIVWVEDAAPAGATTGADGGDSWNWVSANPAPHSGSKALQSATAAGSHQMYFSGATATMSIGTGDTLYAYVYLDPANPPTELMLQWNDGTWEHRAYWGANTLGYGIDGTVSRRYMGALPATGQWVQLQVPASQVGLQGSTLNGMAFSANKGRVTWDTAGRLSSN